MGRNEKVAELFKRDLERVWVEEVSFNPMTWTWRGSPSCSGSRRVRSFGSTVSPAGPHSSARELGQGWGGGQGVAGLEQEGQQNAPTEPATSRHHISPWQAFPWGLSEMTGGDLEVLGPGATMPATMLELVSQQAFRPQTNHWDKECGCWDFCLQREVGAVDEKGARS